MESGSACRIWQEGGGNSTEYLASSNPANARVANDKKGMIEVEYIIVVVLESDSGDKFGREGGRIFCEG